MGNLVEAVLCDNGTDLYRFKQNVETRVTGHHVISGRSFALSPLVQTLHRAGGDAYVYVAKARQELHLLILLVVMSIDSSYRDDFRLDVRRKSMKILVCSTNFAPEPTGIGKYSGGNGCMARCSGT